MECACDWQSPAAAGRELNRPPTVASVQRQSPAPRLPGDSCPAVSVFTPLTEEQTFAMTPGHKDARWYPFTFCSEFPSL